MLYLRALAVWLLILLFAVLNGAFRESVLIPQLGNPAAQITSGVLLVACILVLSFLLVRRIGARSRRELMSIGAFWLVLTLAFEFGYGRFGQGKSWHELLAAYTFRDGNMWPIIMLATLLAPWLVGRRDLPRP